MGNEKKTTETVEEIQTTFNEDSLEVLVEEGEVENVSNEEE